MSSMHIAQTAEENISYLSSKEEAALERLIAAVERASLNMKALDGIEKSKTQHSLNFIMLVDRALLNDYIAHAINVFYKQGQSVTFWYLYECKKPDIDGFCKEENIDLKTFSEIEKKLKIIRNKTCFHYDKKYVMDYSEAWKEAELKGDVLRRAVEQVWKILNFLHRKHFGKEYDLPSYDGRDAKAAAKFIKILEESQMDNFDGMFEDQEY